MQARSQLISVDGVDSRSYFWLKIALKAGWGGIECKLLHLGLISSSSRWRNKSLFFGVLRFGPTTTPKFARKLQ
jgi:hypothetical protein